MSRDGAINYGRYTTAQLREALSTIDRTRFPVNFAALQRELATRISVESSTILSTGSLDESSLGTESLQGMRSGRPGFVWVIIILHAFVLAVAFPSTIATSLGVVTLPEPFASYYSAFDLWDYFFHLGIPFTLAAAFIVSLFRMKRAALALAIAIWVYGLTLAIWKNDEYAAIGIGWSQTMIGRVIGLLIIAYLWHLAKTKRLA